MPATDRNEYKRAWAAANRNSVRASKRAWKEKNVDRVRELKRVWYAKHAAERIAYNTRKYQANPLKVKLQQQRRRARLKDGKSAGVLPEEWKLILEYYENQCVYCGGPPETVDHVVPIARGGLDEITNVVPACRKCNCSKGAKLLSEWGGR